MIENKFTVGQIAQKFGISARAVRHYENIGLLESDRDAASNYRLYGEAQSNRVYQILLLKGMGFTLKETSSIITCNGNKNIIIEIINSRLKSLTKKSALFNQCIDLLNEFLMACSRQENENIDSFKLLNDLLSDQKKDEAPELPEEFSPAEKSNRLMEDTDLEVLRACLSEDLNPLYLPFIVGREDGELLENFFVSHRRFWGLSHVHLTDGSNLQDIYNPQNFGGTIINKIGETVRDSGIYQPEEDISYKHIVADLCNTLLGVDYTMEDPLPVLEMKLVAAVFARALEMLELAGQLNEKSIRRICETVGLEENHTTKQEVLNAVNGIIDSGGIQAFYLTRLVDNAIKRDRYVGPFYVLTEASAFSSSNWELDRALDMAAGFLWTHEISPAGQPYQTLMPVIFHIAYMRMRMLYASATHIQPEIAVVDSFMIIGLELITTDKDGEGFARIPKFEEEEYHAKRVCENIPNRVRPGIRYGVNCRRKEEYYSYIAGEQVSSLENIPAGMTGELIPAGNYAIFTVNGGPLPYKVIETIVYIYQHWLPASGYQWVDRPGFHLYLNASGRSDSDIRIYIPIEEKGPQL